MLTISLLLLLLRRRRRLLLLLLRLLQLLLQLLVLRLVWLHMLLRLLALRSGGALKKDPGARRLILGPETYMERVAMGAYEAAWKLELPPSPFPPPPRMAA